MFLESSQAQIKGVLRKDPSLEVYKVNYTTAAHKPDEWFEGGRWPLQVPENVSGGCYDVILVDAPQGFKPLLLAAGPDGSKMQMPGAWVMRRACLLAFTFSHVCVGRQGILYVCSPGCASATCSGREQGSSARRGGADR